MQKLLIATTNQAKIAEYQKFLSDLSFELVSLKDIGITQKADETGKTLEENALIKARFYSKLSGLPALSDDGGFEIETLGGEPGVKSHRWIHQDREDSDEEIIAHALKRMKGIPLQKRGAKMRLVIALVLPDGQEFTSTGEIQGIVSEKPYERRHPGFPYRSLLFISELNKYYEELNLSEHEKYNHRRIATEKMKLVLKNKLGF